ncbi:MAG: hypothetical protein PHQ81_11455 [Methanofollis sp.]|nr:hypothetical protein [Methanofollis sp.]
MIIRYIRSDRVVPFEQLKRLEELNVVRTRQVKKGRGRTREIVVVEGVEEVISGAVSAGSSGESMNEGYRSC